MGHDLSLDEIKKALNCFQKNKTAGDDSLSCRILHPRETGEQW